MNYEQFEHNDKKIFLIDMKQEENHYFSELFDVALKKYLKTNKKIGIIINKKGYSQGLICKNCWYIPQCEKCSVSITYHKLLNNEMMGLCHICKTQYQHYTTCPQCWSTKLQFYGIGIEQLAEIIAETYHEEPIIINTDTSNSPNKIKKNLTKIKEEKPKIIIWTSILSQPIFFYPLDLIIFIDADIGLNIPDFSANENNFLLLYETFQKHSTKNFIVQTFNPSHYSIREACRLNYEGFYQQENELRKKYKYPPFWELCIILYKDEIEERMYNKVDKLYQELLYLQEKYQFINLEIYTTPPLIYKTFGKFRYNIIIKGENVREFIEIIFSKLSIQEQGFKIHRDAESIV